MSEYESEYERLVASTWPTQKLAGFALYWQNYDDGRTPLWHRIVGSDGTLAEAEAFYKNGVSDDEELRALAVDALLAGGWTLYRINWRKS